jgi:hypothetical protein
MIDHDPLKPLSDEFIDRIVGGELTPAELRDAVNGLDCQPDAWKRCALAFLEAQCWRESLQAIGQPTRLPVDSRTSSISLATASSTRRPASWLRAATLAASVAASFVLGWVAQTWRPFIATDHNSPAMARTSTVQPAQGSETSSVDELPLSAQNVSDSSGEDRTPPTPTETIREVATLLIRSENAQTEVPILAGPGIDSKWIENQPPPISEHEQVVFQRHGYQVDQRRRLISATLSDGRRVTVPIDQVQIHYTGNQTL